MGLSFNLGRFLSNPIKGIGNAIKSIGKVGRQAAPFAGLIPGVGPGIGALIGGGGALLEGKNIGEAAMSGLTGGLSGLGNAKLLGGKGFKGLASLSRAALAKLGGGSAVKGVNLPDRGPGVIDPATGEISYPGAGSGILPGEWDHGQLGGGGLFDSILGFLKGHGVDLVKAGLAGAGAISAANQQGKANDYRDKALAAQEAMWASGAPLRKLGMQGLTDPRVIDLSSAFRAPTRSYQRISA